MIFNLSGGGTSSDETVNITVPAQSALAPASTGYVYLIAAPESATLVGTTLTMPENSVFVITCGGAEVSLITASGCTYGILLNGGTRGAVVWVRTSDTDGSIAFDSGSIPK